VRIRLSHSGFTLIEILVVIVVLAGMVAPNVFKHVGEAKNAPPAPKSIPSLVIKNGCNVSRRG